METVHVLINELLVYALNQGLLNPLDKDYAVNRILQKFNLNEYIPLDVKPRELDRILEDLLDEAVKRELIDDTLTERDLFDAEIMDCLIPRPSEVNRIFWNHYQESPVEATDYFYHLSQHSHYIRTERINRNVIWKVNTPYGEIDLTINLSKPEKDPKEIAKSRVAPKTNYPKCLLCKENVGYAGHANHPGRANHRIIPVTLRGESWYLQYSPYSYYNEHCIILNEKHEPMQITGKTFSRLLDFVHQFPHYFVGSNADLPIVGGSILDHDHYQGGQYEFAMARAKVQESFRINGVDTGIVHWPMSVLRLRSNDRKQLVSTAELILSVWKEYSDPEVNILATTEETPHNTITPIARFKENAYELDLVLRNNRTTDTCPDGIFHARAKDHHLKRENIGLIEVMGLAVLPARLKKNLERIKSYILEGVDFSKDPELNPHLKWVEDIERRYPHLNKDNINHIFDEAIGLTFMGILETCGVFKQDEMGQCAFRRFIDSVSKHLKS